jgi:hypothetical protein
MSVRGWVSPRAIVLPEGLCQWKIRITPSGIEPVTYRLVTHCLNQLRHRVPPSFTYGFVNPEHRIVRALNFINFIRWPVIFVSSVWKLFGAVLLATNILRWFPDFWKMLSPLSLLSLGGPNEMSGCWWLVESVLMRLSYRNDLPVLSLCVK